MKSGVTDRSDFPGMCEKCGLESDERVFTLSDLYLLVLRCQKRILYAALWGGLGFFAISSTFALKHRIESTFKEGAESTNSELSSLKQLFGMSSTGGAEPQVVVLMKSYPVLKPLIERLGLQATVSQHTRMTKLALRIRDNFLAEFGTQIADTDDFVFHDLFYKGERAVNYSLQFSDPEHFSLLSGATILEEGVLGTPLRLPELTFTLSKAPQGLRLHHPYPLCIESWIQTANHLRQGIRISANKFSQSVYDLQLEHRNRHTGTMILNELMQSYCNYLKLDYDRVSTEQLNYLEYRQGEIYGKLSGIFDEHAAYLQENLNQKGFLGVKQEAEGISNSYQQMLEKLLAVQMELDHISLMDKEKKSLIPSGNGSFFTSIQNLVQEMQNLRQQKDLFELSLQGKDPQLTTEQQFLSRQEELKSIRCKEEAVQNLLILIETESPIPCDPSLFDPVLSLSQWGLALDKASHEEKGALATYLKEHLRLLSMQEKMVQERMFYAESPSDESVGLDLHTSHTLLLKYNTQIDANEMRICHLRQLSEQISAADFELSALGATLTDPLSVQLLNKASSLSLQLKDAKSHSEKEGLRWNEELLLSKKILADHVAQLMKLEQLHLGLAKEKMYALRRGVLECINGQLSVLQKQLDNSFHERVRALGQEGDILQQAMADMREGFTDLPERWRKEKWLDLRMQMGVKMIQALSEIVESKTIGRHLHHVESKPLDLATPPLSPTPPRLFLKAFLGSFGLGGGVFFLALIQSLIHGFPTSPHKLRAMRYPFLGEIGARCHGVNLDKTAKTDLALLRSIALFINTLPKKKIVGLLTTGKPDYSGLLGELLGKMALRILIIRCDFDKEEMHPDPSDALSIQKGKECDHLTWGKLSVHGVEFMQSASCKHTLEQYANSYDHILLLTRAPLDAAEHLAALRLCDGAIVTVSGESTELLTPFIKWAYHGEVCRLAFIALGQG
ncbi:MAG: hypothetical protein HY861_01800 [Chlamydiia bacterium]|nr:hypothetical protein [Chlamydiia bacterium]